jgi:hypothetical protein
MRWLEAEAVAELRKNFPRNRRKAMAKEQTLATMRRQMAHIMYTQPSVVMAGQQVKVKNPATFLALYWIIHKEYAPSWLSIGPPTGCLFPPCCLFVTSALFVLFHDPLYGFSAVL